MAEDDDNKPQEQAAAVTLSSSTTTTSTEQQPQQQNVTSSGRGRNGGRGRSGRGQRSSSNSGGRGGRGGGGRGDGGRGQQQQQSGRGGRGGTTTAPPVVSIAPNTGIPFGHVPAYLPGSSSLVEDLDQRIMVVLRDGRHLLGTFRSFDQFSNMVLDDASERKMHVDMTDGITYYADIPLGLYMVRGDSVVLLGQIGDNDDGNNMTPETTERMKSLMKEIDLDELEQKIATAASSSSDNNVPPTTTTTNENTSGQQQHVLEWDFDKDLHA